MSKEAMKLALEALEGLEALLLSMGLTHLIVYGDAEKAINNLQESLAEQPAQQEPDELRHIGEQDCLLDVDEKAWRSLVENRGGCRCHISPPCGACSNPISEEEMNEVGYTYTSPQPAQQEPVAVVSGYYGGKCVILPIDPARIFNSNTPLYTSPQPCPTCEALARTVMLDQTSHDAQRTWVGLTDEAIWLEYQKFWPFHPAEEPTLAKDIAKFARAIEAKLKEKNT